jgi:hypothetical protein
MGRPFWLSGFAFGGAVKLVLVDHDWPWALFLIGGSICFGWIARRVHAS